MDLPVPESWSEAAPLLLPVVRRSTEPAHAWAAERADPKNRLLRAPLAPHLRELVAIDLPDVRMFANHGHLATWGIDAATAHHQARVNLREGNVGALEHRADWNLWHLPASDGYEPSRLCLRGWVDAAAIPGEPVVAIPTSRSLLVASSEDEASLGVLLDLCQRAFREAGGPLSPVLYGVGPTGLAPWEPPADHPLRAQVDFAQRLLAVYEYSEQAEQLQHAGWTDVASIALHKHPVTGAKAVASWPDRAREALLPRCDEVRVGEAVRSFEVVVAGIDPEPGLTPSRWRVPAQLDPE